MYNITILKSLLFERAQFPGFKHILNIKLLFYKQFVSYIKLMYINLKLTK